MADNFADHQSGLDGPARNAAAVTPNDSTDLTTSSRAIYVGGDGNLSVVLVGGDTVTLTAVQAGVVYPLRCARVRATGTTATDLVALW